jgi:hypothetical protein
MDGNVVFSKCSRIEMTPIVVITTFEFARFEIIPLMRISLLSRLITRPTAGDAWEHSIK